MRGRLLAAVVMVPLLGLLLPAPAVAEETVAFGFDCKEAPTPDMPGQGLAAFFHKRPDPLPPAADPFTPGAETTIYEQYGFAGLRWTTYDLGCGPDAARSPDAVIGTAISSWIMNLPISMTALTASITEVAFEPTFLDVFDPTIRRVSNALHNSLFATWVPAVLALLGLLFLVKARRAALATTAAAIGWALLVILVTTAIFKWPIAAGHFADDTVTTTLGAVVGDLNDRGEGTSPGVAVGSNVHESLLYNSWLAGALGSTDSKTARKYGPELFKAQALTWHEAEIVRTDPEAGQALIEEKKERFEEVAEEIKNSDPVAYEHLTGKRADTRIGYALLSALGALLALPFLLVASLLLLGSFLIVRLAVMMFPAFATLGVFPAGRGLVLGIGRTVGAALINAVIFGIGAAVTIRVLGLILDPASRMPGWLALVLMPLFSFIMWVALKPFRRLTTMVNQHADPFNDAAGSLGNAGRSSKRWLKRAGTAAIASYTGNLAATATAARAAEEGEDEERSVPDRAESRPTPAEAPGAVTVPSATPPAELPAAPRHADAPPEQAPGPVPSGPTTGSSTGPMEGSSPDDVSDIPVPMSESAPLPPTEPEWHDGEEVYDIYRPDENDGANDDAA